RLSWPRSTEDARSQIEALVEAARLGESANGSAPEALPEPSGWLRRIYAAASARPADLRLTFDGVRAELDYAGLLFEPLLAELQSEAAAAAGPDAALTQQQAQVRRLDAEVRRLAAEIGFDEAYYLGTNPDVARSGMPPLQHY